MTHLKEFLHNSIKTISIICMLNFCGVVYSQTFYKEKYKTLQELNRMGIIYAQGNNSDEYWFKTVDKYGENRVKLVFYGNYLQKIFVVQLDPTKTLNRLKDVYAKTTNAEADTFDPPSNGYGSGIASNTPYYSGRAKYECSNNYSTRDYLFIITILD